MNVTKINDLRKLCKKLGLSAGGTKHDLAKRLEVEQHGRVDEVGGQRKCEICNMPAKVTGTSRTAMKDGSGRILITRQVVCTGKHRHTYPVKRIVGEKKV